MGSEKSECIRDENSARIIDAVKRILVRKNPRQITFSEIASVAGVARRTVFNIFGTKNNLLILTAISMYRDFYEMLCEETSQKAYLEKNGLEQVMELHVIRAKYYYDRPYIVQLASEVETMSMDSPAEVDSYHRYMNVTGELVDYYWRAVQEGEMDGSVQKGLSRNDISVILVFAFSAITQKLCSNHFNANRYHPMETMEVMRTLLRTTRSMLKTATFTPPVVARIPGLSGV